ncbi:MAG TPA: hypothetical protein VF634_00385 [Pyrinomonadaceae bacterium]
MKEFGNTLAQLFFIIMVMIVLAVSTATLSQWASSETSATSGSADDGRVVRSETVASSPAAPAAH